MIRSDDRATTTGQSHDPPTQPSARAPEPDTPFRRPSTDPTLGDGAKVATTPAWSPTPTLTEHRDDPAVVVDAAAPRGDGGQTPAGRVAAALERLGRPVHVVAAGTVGVVGNTAAGPGYPLVVHVGSAGAGPDARAAARTVAAYRSRATITYDAALPAEATGPPDAVVAHVEDLVAQADVVRVRAADLDRLYPGEEHGAAVRRWLGGGPAIVIVSGAEGTTAANAVGEVATSATSAVADENADAAFMAAVIDALWKGGMLGVVGRPDLRTLVWGSLKELVDHATAAAAITRGSAPAREELTEARGIPQLAGG